MNFQTYGEFFVMVKARQIKPKRRGQNNIKKREVVGANPYNRECVCVCGTRVAFLQLYCISLVSEQ